MLHAHGPVEAAPHCWTVWSVRLSDGSFRELILDVSLSDYAALADADPATIEEILGRPGDVVPGEVRTIPLDKLEPPFGAGEGAV